MKEMKKARVVYNEAEDRFDVQIKTAGVWGLEAGYPCQPRKGCEDKNYIHWSILAKMKSLSELGYSIDFMPVVLYRDTDSVKEVEAE